MTVPDGDGDGFDGGWERDSSWGHRVIGGVTETEISARIVTPPVKRAVGGEGEEGEEIVTLGLTGEREGWNEGEK